MVVFVVWPNGHVEQRYTTNVQQLSKYFPESWGVRVYHDLR